jgi:predicted Zn-dependent peptidase
MKKRGLRITLILTILLLSAWNPSGGALHGDSGTGSSFTLPDYQKIILKNGLTVYLLEQHGVPLIYVSAVFPAGAVKDNGKYGLASLTADALLFGTSNYTKNQIEETLDFLGASYETSASREIASVSMSFLNTDLDKVFPILKEIIIHPTFEETEFEKRKKRLLLELERERERPAGVISSYFGKLMFGDHVYGNPVSGIRSTVTDISVDDLRKFYESNYLPAESAVAIAGDFETKDMKKRIEKLFLDWHTENISTDIRSAPVPAWGKSRVLLVNKDDANETRFRIGGLGIKRSNPDYVAVQVINTILGGRFTSWLNDELRINAGLTYGAYSFFGAYRNSGIFAMNSFTRTETTTEAIDLALEVLDRLHKKGIDQETLTSAKNYMNGQFPPRYETAGSLAALMTSMFVYDFDESLINDFQKNVDEMTVEKAQEIVRKYFPEDNLQFVLIGKASEIREKVKKYGELVEKDITDDGF